MSGLRIIAERYAALGQALLDANGEERCGLGFAHHMPGSDSWVLAKATPVPETAYAHRDAVSASLTPGYLVEIANQARARGLCPVLIHTHPATRGRPAFSAIDDRGEAEIKAYLDARAPCLAPLALVIGPEGCNARVLGTDQAVPVWAVGPTLRLLSAAGSGAAVDPRYDRQVRAFGPSGQRSIARLRILVIGAGGTATATMLQLAYLGARDITTIDPDHVDETNLNRLIGAGPGDIGMAKVAVAKRMTGFISPETRIHPILGDIVDADMAAMIPDFDVVFLCTDSHASRAVANQAAYQYGVPTIDMGVNITVAEQRITHITGRVQMLAPGLPCLTCTRALDPAQIRRELLNPEQRAADPYFTGLHEPQPAVISLNTSMASLAITMFLGAVTDAPALARFQIYDGIKGIVRPVAASCHPTCISCSPAGALMRGSSWPLPVRPSRPPTEEAAA